MEEGHDEACSGYPLTAAGYQVLEEIGNGSASTVYRALCLPYNEVVAIKTLDLEKCNRDVHGIQQDGMAMSWICHPNVVKPYCSFIVDQRLWIVMPYLAGGSCHHIMKAAFANGFEEPVIATVLKESLEGLEYLHRHGHIHGDVKAGNILVAGNGAVRLGDIGVTAFVMDTVNQQRPRVGTPCWSAPEAMDKCSGYDLKSDIWSFGITALELVCGHAPFYKYAPMKVLMTLQNGPPGLGYTHNRRFSESFKDMVAMCLVKDPAMRPTPEKLLRHPFFKLAHSFDYIYQNVIDRLPPLGERVKNLKIIDSAQLAQKNLSFTEEEEISQREYKKGVSSWDFIAEDLKPQTGVQVFVPRSSNGQVKQKTANAVPLELAATAEVDGRESFIQSKGLSSLDFINVLAERDAALLEKSTALAEKMAACAERDAAILQRDVALADRDSAIMERDAAVAALTRMERGASGRGVRKAQTSQVGPNHGSKLSQRVEFTDNGRLEAECKPGAPNAGIMVFNAESSHHPPGMHRFGKDNEPQIEIFVRTKRKAAGVTDAAHRNKNIRLEPNKLHDWTMTHQGQQQEGVAQVDEEEEEGQIREPELGNAGLFRPPPVPSPIPYCSCTGLNQQCYRWGNGGWQSACCTTMISMFPLPMNPKKRGSRLAGRKMSAGAFEKLLEKLLSEGVNVNHPVDLREHWAKHGTNRYVTLR